MSLTVVLWLMNSFIYTIVTSLSACGCYSHFHTLTLVYVLDHKLLEGAAVCTSTFACCIEIRFCESEAPVTLVAENAFASERGSEQWQSVISAFRSHLQTGM